MDSTEIMSCPFCGFQDTNDYQMLLHVEIQHSEDGDSPFVVKDSLGPSINRSGEEEGTASSTRSASPTSPDSISNYVDCPYKCGERIPAAELQFHTDFHMAENMALDDPGATSTIELSTGSCNDEQAVKDISRAFSTNISNSIRNYGQLNLRSPRASERKRAPSLKELFFGSPERKRAASKTVSTKSTRIKRLGTAELGPYAHEKRMPAWLQQMLEEGAKVTISNTIGPNNTLIRIEAIANETPNLIPVLARLSALDQTVARAMYCSPKVHHVVKMPKEGGFCGYRNIQMLISYIRDSQAMGSRHFPGRLPSIIKLQELIENAWDMGFNSIGRVETGGIRLTRKYIGTPEAQALFLSLGIPCEAVAYSSKTKEDAYTSLMTAVFNYFEENTISQNSRQDIGHDVDRSVIITKKPPIYFQHQGHSMTIVGVEVHTTGAANLVVFDPMFNPSLSIKRLSKAESFRCSDPARLLKAHRRGESYLSKFKDFELLKLTQYGASSYSSVEPEPSTSNSSKH